MADKLKIKTDGIVYMGDIPVDTEELELECEEIADMAFTKNKLLRRLTLINVKKIGEHAFGGCKELLFAELINCKEIGSYAFANEKKLQSVSLSGVEKIGEHAFAECVSLESVEITECETIGKSAFLRCGNLTYANLDCKEVSELSFFKCRKLKKATLLNTEVIGYRAFFDCAIDEVKLPDTLREFGLDAFRYDNEEVFVKNWVIPSSFQSTKKLKLKIDGVVRKGDIPDDIEKLELECGEVDDYAFYKNKSLRILKLINVKKIGCSAFYDCKKLISLEIVNCKEIKPHAFEKSRSLLKLKLTDVEIIGDKSFTGCKSLSSAELVNCGELGKSVFEYCIGLKCAAADCKIIGDQAFGFCKHLENATLQNTEVIGKEAFYSNFIEKIDLPETLISIGDHAFANSKIKHLVIPRSVTELGNDLISTTWYYYGWSVIEIYIKDGRTAFFSPDKLHKAAHTKLVVRSAENSEILYQFMVLDDLETVLTDHGIDFKKYDKMLLGQSDSITWIEAAHMRIHDPIGMNEKTLKKLKDHISDKVTSDLKSMMNHSFHKLESFDEYPYYDDIKINAIIELIFYSAKKDYYPNIPKILMRHLYKKMDDIGSIDYVSDNELMEIIDHSVRQGMTELTALLMQKLHERRIREENE